MCVCVFVLLCTLCEGRKIYSSVSDSISLNSKKCASKSNNLHTWWLKTVSHTFSFILFYFTLISSCKKNIHTDDFTQKFMFNFWSFSWIKVIHFHIEQFSNQRLKWSTCFTWVQVQMHSLKNTFTPAEALIELLYSSKIEKVLALKCNQSTWK